MNARRTQITATGLPLAPINADRTRALVPMEAQGTALTALLTQVSFLGAFVAFYILDYKTYLMELGLKKVSSQWKVVLGGNIFSCKRPQIVY